MAYINYQNLPSTSTPLNATNLNSMQVEESGSNTNGNYIKYNDGTLIQWNTIAKSSFQSSSALSTTVQGINWYRSNNPSVAFPISFIDTNYSVNVTGL
jgi:hypothetical protein